MPRRLPASSRRYTSRCLTKSDLETGSIRLAVISHAGIKQINRAVYRNLTRVVSELTVIVPAQLRLSSGRMIQAEPPLPEDPTIVTHVLRGTNPRTYYYPGLKQTLSGLRPDVVLLENDAVSRLGLEIAGWCRRNGIKLICQTYENIKRGFIESIRSRGWTSIAKDQVINLMNYRMASKVDALLVVNRDSEKIFAEYGYRHIVRIPLGFDKNVFFPDKEKRAVYRNRLSVSPDTVVIAYFGRLVRQKGVHILVRALAGLQTFKWCLLLDHIHDSADDYANEIRSLIAELELQDRVIYFEADHFEIANFMRAADIMVAPSLTTPVFKEQYGRAVQEAMACGCVCVVSDCGHLKDLVNEGALVFKEGDAVMLAGILYSLLSDMAKREEYQSRLIKQAAASLTTDRQAECLVQVIREL